MSTELITYQPTQRAKTAFIRDGVKGNFQVIFEMIRVTRDTVNYDKGFENFVKAKGKGNLFGLQGYNSNENAATAFNHIYKYVKDNIAYILDMAGRIESIKDARQTLSDGYGDCDDHAILNASILGALGFEDVRFAIYRYIENETAFQHVAAICYFNNKRYIFDTTLKDGTLNKEVPSLEVKEIPVFNAVAGLDGFAGLALNINHNVKKIGRIALEVLPTVTALLPLGFMQATALSTGATLISQSGDKKLSLNATASKINSELDKIIQQLASEKIAYDLAKSYAAQYAAQLSTVELNTYDKENYAAIKKSVQQRLDFIGNFGAYANANNIKIVYLNTDKMLTLGAIGAGYGFYKLYQYFQKA